MCEGGGCWYASSQGLVIGERSRSRSDGEVSGAENARCAGAEFGACGSGCEGANCDIGYEGKGARGGVRKASITGV